MYIINKEISEVLYIMSSFYKKCCKIAGNLKLEPKLLLSTIGINLLFLLFFLVFAFSMITSRYHKLLYQSMQSSSALVSYEFTNRLEDLVSMTNIVRSDSTIQSTLDEIHQPQEAYAVHYYSDIYSALQKHYLEYRQPYLKLAAISCPRFITYTNENISRRPDADLTEELVSLAEAGEGSAVWVTSHVEDHGVFLVREIKKIKNLRLDNLGTLIINIDLGDLVKEMSQISNEYKDSYWMIYEGEHLLFSSPELNAEEVQDINHKIRDYGVVSLNGKKYFAIRGTMDINSWDYLHLISYDEVVKSQQITAILYVLILGCGFLCSFLMVHLIVRKITRHFDLLLYRMKKFGEDSTALAEIPYDYTDRADEIGIMHRQFAHMAEQIQTLVVENYRQQLLTKDAQLKSLESQMNPHFLYNTLDAINWRAKAIGEPEISQIADSLGHFLRMTLNKKERFTLKQELDIIHYYMTIQQLRFDNRLNFTESIPDACLDAQVPKLSIQPLLENAVHYALEQITDECIINLTCVYSQGLIQIYVKNSGSEFPDDLLENLRTHKIREQGLGIALLNIEERIKLMFGQQYGLHFYNENDFAVVKMEIPYVKDDYRG